MRILIGAVIIVAIGLFAFYMLDIDQTKEARLPDVEVEGGQAPEYDVDTGSVEVTEEETNVPVPEVTVEEETVTVPGLEVEPPEPDNAEAPDESETTTK